MLYYSVLRNCVIQYKVFPLILHPGAPPEDRTSHSGGTTTLRNLPARAAARTTINHRNDRLHARCYISRIDWLAQGKPSVVRPVAGDAATAGAGHQLRLSSHGSPHNHQIRLGCSEGSDRRGIRFRIVNQILLLGLLNRIYRRKGLGGNPLFHSIDDRVAGPCHRQSPQKDR